jgi:ABC-type dipeptide/oligopeptide/nickel transport system permease subunit
VGHGAAVPPAGVPLVEVVAPAAAGGVVEVGIVAGVVGDAVVGGTVCAGAVVPAAVLLVVVIVAVEGVGGGPESPASFTSAAASTPSASATMTQMIAIGVFQFGVAARRVRAAAPQRRHHS